MPNFAMESVSFNTATHHSASCVRGFESTLLLGLSSALLSASRGLDCDAGTIPACLLDEYQKAH